MKKANKTDAGAIRFAAIVLVGNKVAEAESRAAATRPETRLCEGKIQREPANPPQAAYWSVWSSGGGCWFDESTTAANTILAKCPEGTGCQIRVYGVGRPGAFHIERVIEVQETEPKTTHQAHPQVPNKIPIRR